MKDLEIIRSARVVLPEGERPSAIWIEGGRISRISDTHDVPRDANVTDVTPFVLIPGIVDTHVHLNEPGRTEWEGFETGTQAAAAGGVTTLLDMPLNSIPATTSVRGVECKREAAFGKLSVDVALCAGLVPESVHEVRALARAGVFAFKCFMVESGVPEFGHVSPDELETGLASLAALGIPLLVHAELPGPIDRAAASATSLADARNYATYLSSRPRAAENEAVDAVIRAAQRTNGHAHIVHLASPDAILSLRDARSAGVRVTAETCPHYLSFAAEEIADGCTEFKCAPPIRERIARDMLWDALREGVVGQIVTDHSPSTADLKCASTGDFMRAWGGISSLQFGLVATYTQARLLGIGLTELSRWLSGATSELLGLSGTKGRLCVGADADIVVFDADGTTTPSPATTFHRNKVSPYFGRTLSGRVVSTYLRGVRVFHEGSLTKVKHGRLLTRG